MSISINFALVRLRWGAGLSAHGRNMRPIAALLVDPRRDPSCRQYRLQAIRFDYIYHPSVREEHVRLVQLIVTFAQFIEPSCPRVGAWPAA